jgi:predicted membrane protein
MIDGGVDGMIGEIVTILVLLVASLIVYGIVKRKGVSLNPFGLILFWPFIIAVTNNYTMLTRLITLVFIFLGIYLLARNIRKARAESQSK